MDKQIDKALTTLLGTLAKMKGTKRARATSEAMSELIVKLKGTRAQLKKANKDKELDVDEVKNILRQCAELFESANGSNSLVKEARAFV